MIENGIYELKIKLYLKSVAEEYVHEPCANSDLNFLLVNEQHENYHEAVKKKGTSIAKLFLKKHNSMTYTNQCYNHKLSVSHAISMNLGLFIKSRDNDIGRKTVNIHTMQASLRNICQQNV